MSIETRIKRVILDLEEIKEDCRMTDQRYAIEEAIERLNKEMWWG